MMYVAHGLIFAGLLLGLFTLLGMLFQGSRGGWQPTEADLSWPSQGADASSPRIGLNGYLVRCRRSLIRAGVGDPRHHFEEIERLREKRQ